MPGLFQKSLKHSTNGRCSCFCGISRLALQEECRTLPIGAVWDEFCRREEVPVGLAWLNEVKTYERTVQSNR